MKLSDTKLHMIIEAHSKDEGIEIAKGELNYIHSALDEKVPIAKASAYNMNEKGFKFYAEKISGKDLIIENAGMLKNELIDDIEEYIINKKGSTIFALVDIINNFDKIATERPSFIGRFDVYSVLSSRPQESLEITKEDILNHSTEREVPKVGKKAPKIEVEVPKVEKEEPKVEKEEIKTERELSTVNDEVKPTREESRAIKEEVSKIEERQAHAKKELTVDEFVDECKLYAKNIDCFMDGSTVTALYEKVEEMREDKIPLTVENAEALIEEAADRAEKPKLFSKPKYDKNGCLIITEDHFNF